MFKLEFREAGQWWEIARCSTLEEAIKEASVYCLNHDEDALRIKDPENNVIEL